MLYQQTLTQLKHLRLYGMSQALEEQNANIAVKALPFEERFGFIVDREITRKENARLNRLLKTAKLKVNACIEDIAYSAARNLDPAMIQSLTSCSWITQHQNLIITGATGCGKTWLACAFGHQAARLGFSVLYLRTNRFLEECTIAQADGSLPKKLIQLAKIDLIILDDWGINPPSPNQKTILLDLLDDRINAKTTLIASQTPLDLWHAYIADPAIADAILDRLIHNAHKILLQGESMRKILQPN